MKNILISFFVLMGTALSALAGNVVVRFDANGGEMGTESVRIVPAGGKYGESVNLFPSDSSSHFSSLTASLSDNIFTVVNSNGGSSPVCKNYFSKPISSKYVVAGAAYQYVFEALAVTGTARVVTGQNYTPASQLSCDAFVVTDVCTKVISKLGLSGSDYLERAYTYALAKESYTVRYRVSLFAGSTIGTNQFSYAQPGSSIWVGNLPEPQFNKCGCRFGGWRDGDGNLITEDSIVPSDTTAVTLTANWVDLGLDVDLAIVGADRPVVGQTLVAQQTVLEGCSFKWWRGDVTGTWEKSARAEGRDYVLTEDDYEHWIRVAAYVGDFYVATVKFWFSKLPVVYLDTDGGAAIADKVNYVPSTLRLQGNQQYAEQYNGAAGVKGRGNSSWSYAQKPYKLKLDSKANLFGFGKNKHWVLISNYADNSLIRNELASKMAKAVGVVGMDMTSVELILNGSYNGVYALCEHIRIDENRVDIFDWESKAEDLADALYDASKGTSGWTKDDKLLLEERMSSNLSWITSGQVTYTNGVTYVLADYGLQEDWNLSGGFLYEMDDYWDEVSKFKTTIKQMKVNVSKPEYASTDTFLMSAAQAIWNNYEASFLTVDKYHATTGKYSGELCDMDSCAGYWLVMETMGNLDAVWKSRYSYIDVDGKLKFGPVWDFDWSSDSVSIHGRSDAAPTCWGFCRAGTGSNFFKEWLEDPNFCIRAYELYWSKLRPWLVETVATNGGIDSLSTYLTEAAAKHDTKFKRCGFATDMARLKDYLAARLLWLDEQFASIETLMESVKTASSAYPYDKNDAAVAFASPNVVATNVVCTTDFALLNKGDMTLNISVSTTGATRVSTYLNGLKYQTCDLVDGACSLSIPQDQMSVLATNRFMVSVIVRDANEKVLARNYATFLISENEPEPVIQTNVFLPSGNGESWDADENWSLGEYPNAPGAIARIGTPTAVKKGKGWRNIHLDNASVTVGRVEVMSGGWTNRIDTGTSGNLIFQSATNELGEATENAAFVVCDENDASLAMIDLDSPNAVILSNDTAFVVSNTVGDANFGGLYCKGDWNGNGYNLIKDGAGLMTLKVENTTNTAFGKIQIVQGEVAILKPLYADSITKEGACSAALTGTELGVAVSNAVQLTGKLSADTVNLFVPSYIGDVTWYGAFVAGESLSKAKKCHVYVRDDAGGRIFNGDHYAEINGATIDNAVATGDGRITYGVTLPSIAKTVIVDRTGTETVVDESVSLTNVIGSVRHNGRVVIRGASEIAVDNDAHKISVDGVEYPIAAHYDATVIGKQIHLSFNKNAEPQFGGEDEKGETVPPCVVGDETVELGVTTVEGLDYQVKTCTDLSTKNWENVGESSKGTGKAIRFAIPKSGDKGFYLVEVTD